MNAVKFDNLITCLTTFIGFLNILLQTLIHLIDV